ncbi:MAG: hypothetical protein IKU83_01740 [Lachnospiraceae bacterium]|nr:hypothetical protein [Lachnospiraceae bacterium]
MEYNQFLEHVRSEISKIMPEAKVDIHHILKNNRVALDGLTILEEGETISPTIYLNEFYEKYCKGSNLEELLLEIWMVYQISRCKPVFDVSRLKEFDYIKDRIVFKLINYEENREMLEDMPYKRVLDLAMVFYFIIEDEKLGVATATISNSHLKLWGVSEEEVYQIAKMNTPHLLGWELKNMDSLIEEMVERNLSLHSVADEVIEEIRKATIGREHRSDSPMYVLTNTERFNGACCMLYQDVLSQFAKEQNSDLYILPSSIHEVILLPCSLSPNKEELIDMVREINRTEVSATERLSDQVYRYSLEDGILEM